MVPAVLIGAVVVGIGAVAAFAIPRTRRAAERSQFDTAPRAHGATEPVPVYVRVEE